MFFSAAPSISYLTLGDILVYNAPPKLIDENERQNKHNKTPTLALLLHFHLPSLSYDVTCLFNNFYSSILRISFNCFSLFLQLGWSSSLIFRITSYCVGLGSRLVALASHWISHHLWTLHTNVLRWSGSESGLVSCRLRGPSVDAAILLRLRSVNCDRFQLPHLRTEFVERAFSKIVSCCASVPAGKWVAPNLYCFRQLVKTYLQFVQLSLMYNLCYNVPVFVFCYN